MLVVDASIALTWVFADERSANTDAVFRRVGFEGAHVSAIFHIEVGNVVIQAEKRDRITAAYAAERLGIIDALPITVDWETTKAAWRQTMELSRTEALTLYDASYLELALRLGADLATLDKDLAKAARRRGLTVLP